MRTRSKSIALIALIGLTLVFITALLSGILTKKVFDKKVASYLIIPEIPSESICHALIGSKRIDLSPEQISTLLSILRSIENKQKTVLQEFSVENDKTDPDLQFRFVKPDKTGHQTNLFFIGFHTPGGVVWVNGKTYSLKDAQLNSEISEWIQSLKHAIPQPLVR